jgi:hypothetical protein
MGAWIKDNVFLAAAVALPLLLVALFALATYLPRLWVDPPQHDLAFTNARSYEQRDNFGVTFRASGNEIYAKVSHHGDGRALPSQRLYRYRAKDGEVIQVPFPVTDAMKTELREQHASTEDKMSSIDVPLREYGIVLVAPSVAPDGYRYLDRSTRGAGLFGEIFGMRSRNTAVRISKSGRTLAIPNPEGERYYYGYADVLGWIEPAGEAQ